MDCDTSTGSIGSIGHEDLNLLDYNYADDSRTEHATKRTLDPVWRSKQPPRKPARDSFGTRDVTQSPARAVSFLADTSLSSSYNESCCISYYDQCFETVRKIGEGSFGEVFKVKSKDDGKFYAIKKTKVTFGNKFDRSNKIDEVRRHETIPKHANCVEMFFSWEEYECLYIQLELCETSLEDFARRHVLPEQAVWLVVLDLLMAVQHIHSLNIIHLDIKLENILISPLGRCKLGDFGIAVDSTQDNLCDSLDGDAKYLAPEVLNHRFSKAADVFSLGVVALEVATDLVVPRRGPLWHELRQDCLPTSFLAGLSSDMSVLITCMMTADPDKRPTVGQVLKAAPLVRLQATVTSSSSNATIVALLAQDDTGQADKYLSPPPDSPSQRCTPPCPHSRSTATRHSFLLPLHQYSTLQPPPKLSFFDEDDEEDDRRNSSLKDGWGGERAKRHSSSSVLPGGRERDYYNFVSRQSPRLSPISFEPEPMDTTGDSSTADSTTDSTTECGSDVVNSTPQRGKAVKPEEGLNARRLFN